MNAATAIQTLFDNSTSGLEDLQAAIDAAAGGDYMRPPTGSDALSEAVGRLIADISNKTSSSLSDAVAISVAMNETAVMSANLFHFLLGVDAESQSIASAAEEMASTINEIGRYGDEIVTESREAANAVKRSTRDLDNTGSRIVTIAEAVTETSGRIGAIQQLASRISEISDNIKKISSQTNLLAINAAVEAARAGDAGRGFAVVATEVKALSDRTAAATVEIGRIIQELHSGMEKMVQSMDTSASAVREGSQAMSALRSSMGDVASRFEQVNGNANQIAEALGQQRQAAQEVASGIASVAQSSTRATASLEPIIVAMDDAQASISRQLTMLAGCNIPNKVVRLAQSDHVLWKKRLANMIIGREGLNPNELSDHRNCRLGKWYYKVDDVTLRNRPDFTALEDPHAAVHRHGIEAVRQFNNGNVTGALAEIAKVEAASSEVLRLLRRLER